MYARILLEEREEKGEPLLCFMPKEPSLAARTGLKLSNHMGAPNSCTLMDLSPGGSTFQPEPQYTNKRMRPMQAEQGKEPFGRFPSQNPNPTLITLETNIRQLNTFYSLVVQCDE